MNKIFVGLVAVALLVATSAAQESSSVPLSYRVSLVKLDRKGRTLRVSANITNTSRTALSINPKNLTYRTIFKRSGKLLSNGEFTSGVSLDSISESSVNATQNLVYLLPGQTYSRTLELRIADEFFLRRHSFRLALAYGWFGSAFSVKSDSAPWYGIVEANEIMFRL
ncbi:MAG: hypothetical protein IT172_10015 [Acidobacteria bacterium]|nr:hypothetical protein [Acidobacteriota bacterium]